MKTIPGVVFIITYVLLGSAQDVYLAGYFQGQHPVVTAFAMFLGAVLFFQATLVRRFGDVARRVRSHARPFLILNLLTAMNWLGFFWALKFIEPAVAGAIAFSLVPSFTAVFSPWLRPGKAVKRAEMISAGGILLSIGLLVVGALRTHPLSLTDSGLQTVIGLVLSLVAAVGMSINTFVTKRLADAGFQSNEVMGYRFIGLVLIAGAVILGLELPFPWREPEFVALMSALALGVVTLPMYLIQKGVERAEPITVSILLSLTPGCTLIFEFVEGRIQPPGLSILGVLLCCGFALYGVYGEKRSAT